VAAVWSVDAEFPVRGKYSARISDFFTRSAALVAVVASAIPTWRTASIEPMQEEHRGAPVGDGYGRGAVTIALGYAAPGDERNAGRLKVVRHEARPQHIHLAALRRLKTGDFEGG
jgi:hypothetical protein